MILFRTGNLVKCKSYNEQSLSMVQRQFDSNFYFAKFWLNAHSNRERNI